MKKPELKIVTWHDKIPIDAVCTSCEHTLFQLARVPDSADDAFIEMRDIFSKHFRDVHMREDASQIAFRIVPEATEGK